jgi:hypothetical protein
LTPPLNFYQQNSVSLQYKFTIISLTALKTDKTSPCRWRILPRLFFQPGKIAHSFSLSDAYHVDIPSCTLHSSQGITRTEIHIVAFQFSSILSETGCRSANIIKCWYCVADSPAEGNAVYIAGLGFSMWRLYSEAKLKSILERDALVREPARDNLGRVRNGL